MAAMAWEAGGGGGGIAPGTTGGGGCVFRIAPMMKKRVPIPIAEMKSDSFLPRVSTPKKMKVAVATSFMIP